MVALGVMDAHVGNSHIPAAIRMDMDVAQNQGETMTHRIIIEVASKEEGQAAVELMSDMLNTLGLTAKVRVDDKKLRVTRMESIILKEMVVGRTYDYEMLGRILEKYSYAANSASPAMGKLIKLGWVAQRGAGCFERIKALEEVA